MINTARVAEWRSLRFNSIDDCLAEVAAVEKADRAGVLRQLGNWTPGQVLAHIAAWIEYGWTGYPLRRPPFFIRWILKRRIPHYLEKGLPRGVRIPGVKGGTHGIDAMTVTDAAERLRRALIRLKNGERAAVPNPGFGDMSHEDRVQLTLRHAELHLGYLKY